MKYNGDAEIRSTYVDTDPLPVKHRPDDDSEDEAPRRIIQPAQSCARCSGIRAQNSRLATLATATARPGLTAG
jgi:hypothetical protein